MKITFAYFAQIRQQAGVESETVSAADGTTLLGALKTLDHGTCFRDLLFDGAGALRPMILLVIHGVPAAPERVLQDGECVQLFSPLSGG